MNKDVSTNPGTLLGYGTWVSLGAGRVLIGVGTGTDSNGVMRTFAAGDTGGQYEHEQTEAEIATHYHLTGGRQLAAGADYNRGSAHNVQTWSGGSTVSDTSSSADAGSGDAMDWMQPYLACYIWYRSA